MDQPDNDTQQPQDNLDAFFDAADQKDWNELRQAALNVSRDPGEPNPGGFTHPAWGDTFAKKRKPLVTPGEPAAPPAAPDAPASAPAAESIPPHPPAVVAVGDEEAWGNEVGLSPEVEAALDAESLNGKFIAVDPSSLPGGADGDKPFVLIPANVHAFVPWWGWVTIAVGLVMLVSGIVLLPSITLDRVASRLGDSNEATVRGAMRQLVLKGDERTVRKLFNLASSPNAKLPTRLRAVDTMSLIERVPEVDRALLRLELSASTHEQVREAAIAARRQREAYRSRGRR